MNKNSSLRSAAVQNAGLLTSPGLKITEEDVDCRLSSPMSEVPLAGLESHGLDGLGEIVENSWIRGTEQWDHDDVTLGARFLS